MSAVSFLLIYAAMWAVATGIYVVLFSVGSGLGPKEDMGHRVVSEPEAEAKSHRMPHAA